MSLYRNINKRKKAGTSRPKSKSTIFCKKLLKHESGISQEKEKMTHHNHENDKWHVAEELNGRLAMLGIIAAIGAYALTGQIIPGIFSPMNGK